MKLNFLVAFLLLQLISFSHILCMEENQKPLNFKIIYKNNRSLKEICLAQVAQLSDGKESTNFLDPLPPELQEAVNNTKEMMSYFDSIGFQNWYESETKVTLQLWYAKKTDNATAMGALAEYDKMRSPENIHENCEFLSLLLANESELQPPTDKLQQIIFNCAKKFHINIIKYIYTVYPNIFTKSLPNRIRIYTNVNAKLLPEVLLEINPNCLELVSFCLELIERNELIIDHVIILLSLTSSKDTECCMLLLKYAMNLDIDLNQVCKLCNELSHFKTPLMMALDHRNNCSLKLLLENGAYIFTDESLGIDPLARFFGITENLIIICEQIDKKDEKESMIIYLEKAKEFAQLCQTLKKSAQPKLDLNTSEFNNLIEKIKCYIVTLKYFIKLFDEKLKKLENS